MKRGCFLELCISMSHEWKNTLYLSKVQDHFFHLVLNFIGCILMRMLHPPLSPFVPVSGGKPLCIKVRKGQVEGQGPGPKGRNIKREIRLIHRGSPQTETMLLEKRNTIYVPRVFMSKSLNFNEISFFFFSKFPVLNQIMHSSSFLIKTTTTTNVLLIFLWKTMEK